MRSSAYRSLSFAGSCSGLPWPRTLNRHWRKHAWSRSRNCEMNMAGLMTSRVTPISLRDNPGRSSGSTYDTPPPHQFRTRNDANETQRAQTKSNKTAGKSTKLIDSLPLITVWLQVRVQSEPTAKSIVGQSPVCGRGGLSPQASGKYPLRQTACIAPNAENSIIKGRGQLLLSFLFAVAPNRTMSL